MEEKSTSQEKTSLERARKLVESFVTSIGLEGVDFDEKGELALAFNNRGELNADFTVFFKIEGDALHLLCPFGLAPVAEARVMAKMLEGNFCWQEMNRENTLSLIPATSEPAIQARWPINEMDEKNFPQRIEALLKDAEKWTQTINQIKEKASPASDSDEGGMRV